jgi:hypothetical protein
MSASSMLETRDQRARVARRRSIRIVAAALSVLTAIVYLLIGLQVLIVLDTPSDQIFGFFAAAAYALGVYLLIAQDRRMIVLLGALFQVFVIFQYFNLSTQRLPAYEPWGLLLRIPQVMLLIALVYLEVRLPRARKPVLSGTSS